MDYEIIIKYEGLQLIKKYDRYYIRFMAGEIVEILYEICISNEEAMQIMENHELICETLNKHNNDEPFCEEQLIKTTIVEYLMHEEHYSLENAELLYKKLKKSELIQSLYGKIMIDCDDETVYLEGNTIEKIITEKGMSLSEAYNYLADLISAKRKKWWKFSFLK